MPDLSWLRTADADTLATVALLLLCGVVIVAALAARYGHHAVTARRFVGRWIVRGGRWVAAHWDARWQGCPHCEHCHSAHPIAPSDGTPTAPVPPDGTGRATGPSVAGQATRRRPRWAVSRPHRARPPLTTYIPAQRRGGHQ